MGKATYLVIYNLTCFLLWLYVGFLLLFLPHGGVFSQDGLNPATLWTKVGPWVMRAQTLALMECIHALLGVVKSPFATTAMQVISRLHIIWIIWRLAPAARHSIAMVTTVAAWVAVEIVRYPYYAVNSGRWMRPPQWLTWCRYSAFVILYPIGIFSEVRCIWIALDTLRSTHALRAYPIPMPNLLNFEIDLYLLYCGILLAYIPGSIHLYGYMLSQRSKQLSGSTKPPEKAD